MKSMNLDQFKAALDRAAKVKGAEGVTLQKKLILENYMITDAEGMVVDPESLDVTISAAAPEAEPMEDSQKEALAKSIRREVASRLDAMPRGLSAVANMDERPWDRLATYSTKIKSFSSREMAWKFGTWCLATMGHKKSLENCRNHGIQIKAHTEGVNTQGGFLVPDEMAAELVTLREQYGVFRRNAKIYRMASDTLRIPRKNTGLTAYWVGEAAAATESTMGFDSVQLVAHKLTALTTVSNELLEDSVIDLASDVANEIAYQFAYKEDDAGFNGDGTSTYGGIVGLKGALFVVVFRQFFKTLPWELEEAARIDGASAFGTWWRIMVPLAMPAVVVVFLFSVVWHWNDFFEPFIYLNRMEYFTLPMRLSVLSPSLDTATGGQASELFNEALVMAAVFLVILPPLSIYLFTQRFFVESIDRTGLVE